LCGLRLRRALVEVTSVVAMGSSKFRANSREPENWLGFLTQNSAYNAGEGGLLGC
jgi:hypothetical protein